MVIRFAKWLGEGTLPKRVKAISKSKPESSDELRSRIMRSVKSINTGPEIIVRRLLHRLGYRYRLHRRDLPGRPDIVFFSRRKIIFVHGCFWHSHNCPQGIRTPKTNTDYWRRKIHRNQERDASNVGKLEANSWEVLVIWECELKNLSHVTERLMAFLGKPRNIYACAHHKPNEFSGPAE
jgi:DNA mismatch endonuclease, patch repair protein